MPQGDALADAGEAVAIQLVAALAQLDGVALDGRGQRLRQLIFAVQGLQAPLRIEDADGQRQVELRVAEAQHLDAGERVHAVRPVVLVRDDDAFAAELDAVLVPRTAEDRRIPALATLQRVIARATLQRVVAGAAAKDVRVPAAFQGIVPGATLQDVAAGAALQVVVTLAAAQQVIAHPALQRVIAGTALEDVVARSADQLVVAAAAGER